jgi:hypothetical protein
MKVIKYVMFKRGGGADEALGSVELEVGGVAFGGSYGGLGDERTEIEHKRVKPRALRE